jgi:hypothetical protein
MAAETLRDHLLKHLNQLQALPAPDRLKQRYAKFRAFGHFNENGPAAMAGAEAEAASSVKAENGKPAVTNG